MGLGDLPWRFPLAPAPLSTIPPTDNPMAENLYDIFVIYIPCHSIWRVIYKRVIRPEYHGDKCPGRERPREEAGEGQSRGGGGTPGEALGNIDVYTCICICLLEENSLPGLSVVEPTSATDIKERTQILTRCYEPKVTRMLQIHVSSVYIRAETPRELHYIVPFEAIRYRGSFTCEALVLQ